jgi:hypothetical protein
MTELQQNPYSGLFDVWQWHGMVVIIENELSSRLHNYYGPSLCSSTVPLEALFHHFFLFP